MTFAAQLAGSLLGAASAFVGGRVVFIVVDPIFGLRLSDEDERRGADLSIDKIGANPEAEIIGQVLLRRQAWPFGRRNPYRTA